MNQSPPMGRMLRRALGEPSWNRYMDSHPYSITPCWNSGDKGYYMVAHRSLNTQGVQFRVRQLQWDCIRFRKGLGELYTPDEQNAHLAKPVTKKDILNGYLRAGHYFNNFKPRV